MADTSDIEKKSLEAHVELCAERYRFLEQKLSHMDEKIETQGEVIQEVHDMVQSISDKHNSQVMSWSVGLIGTLLVIIGYLITTYVLK